MTVGLLIVAVIVAGCAAAVVWVARRRDRRVLAMADDLPAVPAAFEDTSVRPYTRGVAPAARSLAGRR